MTTSTLHLGVLEGDGIGPEIVPASVEVVDAALAAAGAPEADWVTLPLGHTAIGTHGAHTPPETLEALAGLDAWLLGPHDSAAYPEPFKSQLNPSGTIRKHFGLFANIRPAKSFEGARAVVAPHRAGWSTLAAMQVPQQLLEPVANFVSSFPEVNHNYERDHRLNLWFVVAASAKWRVEQILREIEYRTGLAVLDLPLQQAFRLDLGFRLS